MKSNKSTKSVKSATSAQSTMHRGEKVPDPGKNWSSYLDESAENANDKQGTLPGTRGLSKDNDVEEKTYVDVIHEKNREIEKLKSELDRLKLNNRLASTIVDSPHKYSNVNDVTAKRLQMNATLSAKTSFVAEAAEHGRKSPRQVSGFRSCFKSQFKPGVDDELDVIPAKPKRLLTEPKGFPAVRRICLTLPPDSASASASDSGLKRRPKLGPHTDSKPFTNVNANAKASANADADLRHELPRVYPHSNQPKRDHDLEDAARGTGAVRRRLELPGSIKPKERAESASPANCKALNQFQRLVDRQEHKQQSEFTTHAATMKPLDPNQFTLAVALEGAHKLQGGTMTQETKGQAFRQFHDNIVQARETLVRKEASKCDQRKENAINRRPMQAPLSTISSSSSVASKKVRRTVMLQLRDLFDYLILSLP